MIKTQAIVLSTVKSNANLIVLCFCEQIGTVSFFIKGAIGSKRTKLGCFQPFTQLEVVANFLPKRKLHYFKEYKISYPYSRLYTNLQKNTIVLFLSEVLSKCLREEKENKGLFSFITHSIKWLDINDKAANFHLIFLLKLSKYLGIFPQEEFKSIAKSTPKDGMLNSLITKNYTEATSVLLNKTTRNELLNSIIQHYYKHLTIGKINSIDVLRAVFQK